jgi:hypothetical protein
MKIGFTFPLPPKELSPNARDRWARIKMTEQYRDAVILCTRQQRDSLDGWEVWNVGRCRLTETYRIAGKRRRDVRNLFAACKTLEDALCPARKTNYGNWVSGAGILPGDDDSVLEHGAPRIERVKTKAEEGVLVEIEEIS